jgi:aryl-alcohol dehydrogenase-like predicted oxidoreductase
MEMRFLGRSGLSVSVISFGTMTFGGVGDFQKLGTTQVEEARNLAAECIDHGVNLFDTADIYSEGASEKVLGEALGPRRKDVLIATKAYAPMGKGPNDLGSSRYHLIAACEASLRRLNTDYIDLYQLHNFDAVTPMEETLRALDDLVRSGKVRYIGCSNYPGWALMKALAISDQRGWERFIAQQIYYSLLARECEYELAPVGIDQGVGILVWSPLAFGLLSGKYRRDKPRPDNTRLAQTDAPGTIVMEKLYAIVDVMDGIAKERSASVAQVALNYLRAKPCVSSIIIGARNSAQLRDNLAAANWAISAEEVAKLDAVSEEPLPYPYWHNFKWGAGRSGSYGRKA